jgi:hypothetical protein
MLEYEWRELETLCERISDLRHRQSHAHRSRNAGLVQGLKEDIAKARRQREQLVHHISTRLGAATAHRTDPADRATRAAPPDDAAPTRGALQAAARAVSADAAEDIVGFF